MSLRKFDTLTDAGKRVRVALDVLKQIAEKKFTAESSRYFVVKYGQMAPNEYGRTAPDGSTELQEIIENARACNVCALGGLFASMIRECNQLTVYAANAHITWDEVAINNDRNTIASYLHKLFTDVQLDMIEAAFESRWEGGGLRDFVPDETRNQTNITVIDKNIKDAWTFGRRYKTPTTRMVAIMKNIVTNRGTFIPK